jgi:glycosyltransferase involved in cell wall biosynthesis
LIPGGLPTFIRGLIKAAPPDIQISVVGLTTDDTLRPVGRWTTLDLGGASVRFFPVARDRNPGGRSAIPLSVKLTAGIARHLQVCSRDCDILEFHRFEPTLPLLRDPRPKSAFVHQNMESIRNVQSDIKWKHLPRVYFALERLALPRFDSVFCVRADAVDQYRADYPDIADRFQFIPTWMDPEVFRPADQATKEELRRKLGASFGLSPRDELLFSVGRLDQQKDPQLLIESFARVHSARRTTRLIIAGDGVLRAELVARTKALGLEGRVTFAGLRSSEDVADLFQISNAFLLTSAYEGMPMSVLEALGCGVPVVTTNVGEVRRVVQTGINGQVVDEHTPEAFAQATLELLSWGEVCRGRPCVEAVRDFVPEKVLAPVYSNYRMLASRGSA